MLVHNPLNTQFDPAYPTIFRFKEVQNRPKSLEAYSSKAFLLSKLNVFNLSNQMSKRFSLKQDKYDLGDCSKSMQQSLSS